LQQVRQQEHPIGGRATLELGELHRGEFVDERLRPVGEHVGHPNLLGDAEGEVQIGEVVTAAYGE